MAVSSTENPESVAGLGLEREAAYVAPAPRRMGWTFPALLVGFGVAGACLLVPQVEQNRQIRWEMEQLKAEHARVVEQQRVNEEFLAAVTVDPTLMTRLAQRQMQILPAGVGVLELQGTQGMVGGRRGVRFS